MPKFIPKEHQKPFVKIFEQLCRSRQPWQVWADFVTMFAIAISNSLDKERAEPRERRYLELATGYQPKEQQLITQLVTATVEALDTNQEQDFLGDLYMSLGMGNHWRGQFFTPYHLCQAMAEMSLVDADEQIRRQGWMSILDPACGAGATLIAAANTLRRAGINYQERALFVGQDIDPVVAMMCYIQLSLLGCPGYVAVGNSLTNPLTGHPLLPECQSGGRYLDYSGLFYNEMGYETGVCCRRSWGVALQAPMPDDRGGSCMKHRGLPQGMTYAQKLAHDRAIAAGIKQAATDAALQIEADTRVQRAMWLMVCSMADAFGLGPKRVQRFFDAFQANSEELERMTQEVDADYAYDKLRQKAEQVTGIKIQYLYEHEAIAARLKHEKEGLVLDAESDQ